MTRPRLSVGLRCWMFQFLAASAATAAPSDTTSGAETGTQWSLPPAPIINAKFLQDIQDAMDASVIVQFPEFGSTDAFFMQPLGGNNSSDDDDKEYELSNHHPGFDSIRLYTSEPDSIGILRKRREDGTCVCYTAFRGTTPSAKDWLQDFDVRIEPIIPEAATPDDDESIMCYARKGFTNFLNRANWNKAKEGLARCLEPDNANQPHCESILTGHSKGAAQALVAAVALHTEDGGTADTTRNTVINFAQIPVLDRGCPYVDSSDVFRFVNTIYNYGHYNDNHAANALIDAFLPDYNGPFWNRRNTLLFDMVPFVPSEVYGDHYGYGFLLGAAARSEDDAGHGTTTVWDGLDKGAEGNPNLKYYAWNEYTIFDSEEENDDNETGNSIAVGNVTLPVDSRIVFGNNTDFRAHDVAPFMSNHSYWNRIQSLAVQNAGANTITEPNASHSAVVVTNGFAGESPCDPYFFEACASLECKLSASYSASESANAKLFDWRLFDQTKPQPEPRELWECGEVPPPPEPLGLPDGPAAKSLASSSSPLPVPRRLAFLAGAVACGSIFQQLISFLL